jgi:hypothetical protein
LQSFTQEMISIGFLLAAFAWTLWWNIDWQRFIKFYGISGPPYRPWIARAVRIFFALCSLGAAEQLRERLLERTRPAKFYWDVLIVAAVCFTVIFLMVRTVEWMASKRRRKLTSSE